MNFRTEVNISNLPFDINYQTPTLLVGSCFTQNIGAKLSIHKIPTLSNPFGALYNPISVGNCIDTLLTGTTYNANDLQFENELWFNYNFHSKFSSPNKDECLSAINATVAQGHSFLKKTQVLIITLGTARIYRLLYNKQVVANCHKTPAKCFVQELLTPEQIVSEWTSRFNKLLSAKPSLRVILTVSPIRHWKDGATQNQMSKATLLLAVHRLVDIFPNNVFYFPSYEIMIDDLRDYRFYADDMLHPSTAAIEYIWEKFQQATFSPDTLEIARKVETIVKAVAHRPFNTNTESYRTFVQKTLTSAQSLCETYPEVDLRLEIENLLQRR